MSRLALVVVTVALAAAACSPAPAPKPLPGGPPPEYEAPRAFSLDRLENSPGKPLVTGPQPPAPTGVNPTTVAPGPPGPPAPSSP